MVFYAWCSYQLPNTSLEVSLFPSLFLPSAAAVAVAREQLDQLGLGQLPLVRVSQHARAALEQLQGCRVEHAVRMLRDEDRGPSIGHTPASPA